MADAAAVTAPILSPRAILLGGRATDKWDAVRQAGALLVGLGAVEPGYADAMQERERSMSTCLGEGVAIPHGTDASRALVRRTTLGFLQFPGGVDWDGQLVTVCIPIAASDDEHVVVLSALAQVLMDPDKAHQLRTACSVDAVLALLTTSEEEST